MLRFRCRNRKNSSNHKHLENAESIIVLPLALSQVLRELLYGILQEEEATNNCGQRAFSRWNIISPAANISKKLSLMTLGSSCLAYNFFSHVSHLTPSSLAVVFLNEKYLYDERVVSKELAGINKYNWRLFIIADGSALC